MVPNLIISTPIICFTLIKYYLNCIICIESFYVFKNFFLLIFLGTYEMQKFKTVDELINQLKTGKEPIYCIRKKSIQSASTYFRNKFPGKVLYAVKTNSHPDV